MARRLRHVYRKDGWVLCYCLKCGRLNYVEPHGTTAKCACSPKETEHHNLPYQQRSLSGSLWLGPNRMEV